MTGRLGGTLLSFPLVFSLLLCVSSHSLCFASTSRSGGASASFFAAERLCLRRRSTGFRRFGASRVVVLSEKSAFRVSQVELFPCRDGGVWRRCLAHSSDFRVSLAPFGWWVSGVGRRLVCFILGVSEERGLLFSRRVCSGDCSISEAS